MTILLLYGLYFYFIDSMFCALIPVNRLKTVNGTRYHKRCTKLNNPNRDLFLYKRYRGR